MADPSYSPTSTNKKKPRPRVGVEENEEAEPEELGIDEEGVDFDGDIITVKVENRGHDGGDLDFTDEERDKRSSPSASG